jgi:hypothetical protein
MVPLGLMPWMATWLRWVTQVAYEHFDQYAYNTTTFQRANQVKSLGAFFQSLWARTPSLAGNLVVRDSLGPGRSSADIGGNTWNGHIHGAFGQKRARTGTKMNPGRSG